MRASIALALLSSTTVTWAQDIHFTQFTNSPMLQNAGLVGMDESIGLIYRNQWRSIDEPFVTFSGFGETYFPRGYDRIGLGLVLLHDKAGPGELTSSQVWISASYHLKLGRAALILGLQPGLVRRTLQPVTYPSMYDPTIGDFNLALGSQPVPPISYFDLNAGVTLALASGQATYCINQSMQHVLEPGYSFLGNRDEVLPIRSTTFIIVEAPLSEHWRIKPGLLFSKHRGATEVNLQARLYREINSTLNRVMGGLGLRNNTKGFGEHGLVEGTDAPFLVGGFTYKDAEFSVSYDINVSSLHNASNYHGALEWAITWRNTQKVFVNELVVPCIRI